MKTSETDSEGLPSLADQGAPRPTQGQLGIARPSRPSHPSREATGASRPEPKPERRQCWRRVTSFGPRRQECRRSRLLPMNLSPVRQAFLPAGSGGFPAPRSFDGPESPPNRQPGKAALRGSWSQCAVGEPLSLPTPGGATSRRPSPGPCSRFSLSACRFALPPGGEAGNEPGVERSDPPGTRPERGTDPGGGGELSRRAMTAVSGACADPAAPDRRSRSGTPAGVRSPAAGHRGYRSTAIELGQEGRATQGSSPSPP